MIHHSFLQIVTHFSLSRKTLQLHGAGREEGRVDTNIFTNTIQKKSKYNSKKK